jgi:hypothetical protein
MNVNRFIPNIKEFTLDKIYFSSIKWYMKSIILAELAIPESVVTIAGNNEYRSNEVFEALMRNRTAMMQAISTWNNNIILELHVVSSPNLAHNTQGHIQVFLVLHAKASSREESLELCLQSYLSVQALLKSCVPEAEFYPEQGDGLSSSLPPFEPGCVMQVARRVQQFDLTRSISTGFLAPHATASSASKSLQYIYPWVSANDSRELLFRLLLWQSCPTWLMVRFGSAPDSQREFQRLRSLLGQIETEMNNLDTPNSSLQQLTVLQSASLRRLCEAQMGGLRVAVAVATLQDPSSELLTFLGNSITILPGGDSPFAGGFETRSVDTEVMHNPWSFPDPELHLASEAAAAFFLPYPPLTGHHLAGMETKRFRSNFCVKPAHQAGSVTLGTNAHRGVRQDISLSETDRLRHMFVVGMTGTGKSTFLKNLVLDDIEQGRGLCLIDPHGELIEDVLPMIPAHRHEDVILFDPMDKEFPVGMNILEWNTIEERDYIIDDIYHSFSQMYDMNQAGGPIFESYFRNFMRILLGNKKRSGFTPTIFDFTRTFSDQRFREYLLRDIDDIELIDFMKQVDDAGGDASLRNISPYIVSKLGRFTLDVNLKLIFGQEKTAFQYSDVIGQGKVLLINLRKGKLGPTVGNLVATCIVKRLKSAAMSSRGDEIKARKPFFIYVDEFQNVAGSDFDELLAEARKYRVGLIMANQYMAQLGHARGEARASTLVESILGNVGTFISFRVGVKDAEVIDQVFYPAFSKSDLCNLPNYQAYVRMNVAGQSPEMFNIEAIFRNQHTDVQVAETIRALSRKKYGTSPTDVLAAIKSKSDMILRAI